MNLRRSDLVLKSNLDSLKKYYPDTYEKVVNYDIKGQLYKKVRSKNGMDNLLLADNSYLHSKYDPQNEAVTWIQGIDLKEDTLLIIGLGLGYYLAELKRRYSTKKIIIIEPDLEIFIHALARTNISTYLEDDNIVFIIAKDPFSIRSLIQFYLRTNKIRKIHFTEVFTYKRIYNDFIQDLYSKIETSFRTEKGNLATEMSFSFTWLDNTIKNLKYILKNPDVSNLKGLFENLPVIIVSAGPSLEKNINDLKNLYHKALIISVGSAANILEKHNICPHIMLGIDGEKRNQISF